MPDKAEWEIDLRSLRTMREVVQFQKDLGNNDLEHQFRFAARYIKKWPFASDPGDPESYYDLEYGEWQQVEVEFRKAVQAFFRNKDAV